MSSPAERPIERTVCVYCASSRLAHPDYRAAARRLGEVLAAQGVGIVYGGGAVGSMGALADGALSHGGRVTGILPRFMAEREWGHKGLTDLQLVEDLRTRKHMMLTLSQAAIALPGGSGTLEELLEAITLKRLGLYLNPIVLVNTRGFFTPLLEVLTRAVEERFMDPRHLMMWQVVASPEEVPGALASAAAWSAQARDFAAVSRSSLSRPVATRRRQIKRQRVQPHAPRPPPGGGRPPGGPPAPPTRGAGARRGGAGARDRGGWGGPSGLLGRQLERADVARMFAEQRQPEGDRVLSRSLRQLVDHDLLGVRHVRVLDGPPPQHRHADLGLRPADVRIRKIVLFGGVAPDRRRIDAVLDHHGRERRAGDDRLTDHALAVGDLAVLADGCGHAVIVERPVAPAGNVILARPDEAHRVFSARRPGDRGDFGNVVRVGGRPPSESAAGGERVDAHLLGLQSDRRRGIRLVHGLKLAAGPDLALVGAELTDRGQRLHRRVRQVRKLELPLDAFHRMRERRLDVALLHDRHRVPAAAQGAVFLHELGGAALLGVRLV